MIDKYFPTFKKVVPSLLFAGMFIFAAYSIALGSVRYARANVSGPLSVFADAKFGSSATASAERCLDGSHIPFVVDGKGNVKIHQSNLNAAIAACS